MRQREHFRNLEVDQTATVMLGLTFNSMAQSGRRRLCSSAKVSPKLSTSVVPRRHISMDDCFGSQTRHSRYDLFPRNFVAGLASFQTFAHLYMRNIAQTLACKAKIISFTSRSKTNFKYSMCRGVWPIKTASFHYLAQRSTQIFTSTETEYLRG